MPSKKILQILILTSFILLALPVFAIGEAEEIIDEFLLEDAIQMAEVGLFDEALETINEFIALNPNYAEGIAFRGQIHTAMENYAIALEDMQTALNMAVDDAEALARIYVLRGEVYVRQGNLEAMLADYLSAIQADPEYALAYRNLAIVYEVLGETDLAIENYTAVLELEPDNVDIYVARANIYRDNNNPESALEDMTTAITINPEEPALYIQRGHIQNDLGNVVERAEDYAQWLSGIELERTEYEDLILGETAVLEMELGQIYQIAILAEVGQRVSVFANSVDVDAIVVVLDEDGVPIVSDDDSGVGLNSAILEYPIAIDGTYTLLVGHARGGWNGEILLTVFLTELEGI